MSRLISSLLVVFLLAFSVAGCSSNESTVIEPPAETEVSETELESQTEDYEEAMSEMGKP